MRIPRSHRPRVSAVERDAGRARSADVRSRDVQTFVMRKFRHYYERTLRETERQLLVKFTDAPWPHPAA